MIYTCKIIMHTCIHKYICKIIMHTCEIIMYTCKIIMYTCKIIMYTCRMIMYTCKIIMYTCINNCVYMQDDYVYMQDIKNNAWVTVNNDLRDFHEWRSHEWKLLANRITSDPKIVIHGNEGIILFLTRYFMSWTHNSPKNNHRSLISQLSPRTVVSDLALWRHHSGSVTSREREILALWRHICRLFLHAQIGTKAIFTCE